MLNSEVQDAHVLHTSVGGRPSGCQRVPAVDAPLGLGGLAVLLAGLSLWTRKNSRHPLLLVGLAAFAIMFLGYQWMSRTVRDAAWAQSQATAIVTGAPAGAAPEAAVGAGIYLGAIGAIVLVLFGLTIVVKRVPSAYAVPEDDDV